MKRLAWSGLLVVSMISPVIAGQARPLDIIGQLPDGSVVSNNWSGYAVTGRDGSVMGVAGSWIVPEAICNDVQRKNTGASFWVGIDGYNSATVEQTGTDSDCSKGSPKYYAWYEIFPRRCVTIKALAVSAGDTMSASVSFEGAKFRVTITDVTTNRSFSIAKASLRAKRGSAEWITEDNSRTFTDFAKAAFGHDFTGAAGTCDATIDGVTNPVGAFPKYHMIEMESRSGRRLAAPAGL